MTTLNCLYESKLVSAEDEIYMCDPDFEDCDADEAIDPKAAHNATGSAADVFLGGATADNVMATDPYAKKVTGKSSVAKYAAEI